MKLNVVLLVVTILAINLEKCLSENLELLILHNNDMHSRFEEKDGVGGMARVATVVKEARKNFTEGKGRDTLFLNAGDTYTGTIWFNAHLWEIVSEFLNLLNPDVMSFGNHEFDYKIQGVVPFIKASTVPIVAANMDFSKEPTIAELNIPKSFQITKAGKKIGVIGYLTPETSIISSPERIVFEDEVSAIIKESERLDKEGVKIIIALGHSGYEMDQKIAKEVPLVDLVIGGHTNTFLWNGEQPDKEEIEGPYPTVVTQDSGKKVYVVQANAYTKYMGMLDITFDDNGDVVEASGQPLLLNNLTTAQDPGVLTILEKYRPAVDELYKEVVGYTRVTLDGEKDSCRSHECNFLSMMADAFVAYHSSQYNGAYWTDAPIGIINAGGVKMSVISEELDGRITRGQLLDAIPFLSQIWTMTLIGSDLLEALEIGVRGNDDGLTSGGELLQASGIHYKYDKTKPVGSRIIEAKARCALCKIPIYEPIDPIKPYKIITTDYLNIGGDEHFVFRDKGYDKVVQDLIDIDTVVWYLNKFGPVYPGQDERFARVEGGGSMRLASVFLTGLVVFASSFVR